MGRCRRKTVYISYEFESKDDREFCSRVKQRLTAGGFNVTDFYYDGKPGATSIHERRRLIEEATWTIILKTSAYNTGELLHEEAMAIDVTSSRNVNSVLYIRGGDSTQVVSSLSFDNTWVDLLDILSHDPPVNFHVCYNPKHVDLTESLSQVASRSASAPAKLAKGRDKTDYASSPILPDWVACNLSQALKEQENERRAQLRLSCCSVTSVETIDSLSEVSPDLLDRGTITTECSRDERDPHSANGLKTASKPYNDFNTQEPLIAKPKDKSSVCSKDRMKCNFINVSDLTEELSGHPPQAAFQPDVYVTQSKKRSSVCAIL